MSLLFWWYLGFYLNICSVAKENEEISLHVSIKAMLLPYIGFMVLHNFFEERILWKK